MPVSAPYVLPDTEQFALPGPGGDVVVSVARAPGATSVLYLLDGNACFATAVEAVRLRGARPDVSGVAPAWVVGIGYPTDAPHDMVRRCLDYTPPSPRVTLPPRPGGEAWPPMGGADRFLDFIAETLKPELRRRFALAPAPETFFGHSFGGLCVLHALFTRPDLFDRYAAASPSIWWNECFILGVTPRAAPSRELLLMSGSDETGGPFTKQAGGNLALVRDLAQRLAGVPGLSARCHEFSGEDHGSVLPAAIGRAVTLACRQEGKP
jgi:predicted alpha/beta superfamily hydrolase